MTAVLGDLHVVPFSLFPKEKWDPTPKMGAQKFCGVNRNLGLAHFQSASYAPDQGRRHSFKSVMATHAWGSKGSIG